MENQELVQRARELLLPQYTFQPAVEGWFWRLVREEYLRREAEGKLDENFQLKFILLQDDYRNDSDNGINWKLVNWERGNDLTFAPSDLRNRDENGELWATTARRNTVQKRAEALAIARAQLDKEFPPKGDPPQGEQKKVFHEWLQKPLNRPQKKRARNLLRKQQEE